MRVRRDLEPACDRAHRCVPLQSPEPGMVPFLLSAAFDDLAHPRPGGHHLESDFDSTCGPEQTGTPSGRPGPDGPGSAQARGASPGQQLRPVLPCERTGRRSNANPVGSQPGECQGTGPPAPARVICRSSHQCSMPRRRSPRHSHRHSSQLPRRPRRRSTLSHRRSRSSGWPGRPTIRMRSWLPCQPSSSWRLPPSNFPRQRSTSPPRRFRRARRGGYQRRSPRRSARRSPSAWRRS